MQEGSCRAAGFMPVGPVPAAQPESCRGTGGAAAPQTEHVSPELGTTRQRLHDSPLPRIPHRFDTGRSEPTHGTCLQQSNPFAFRSRLPEGRRPRVPTTPAPLPRVAGVVDGRGAFDMPPGCAGAQLWAS